MGRPGVGEAVDGVSPAVVVRPGTVAEVEAAVRLAADGGLALVASGLGQHLDVGGPPRRFDVLLRLDRLHDIVRHEAADMTVTALAGCPLSTLGRVLGACGQWLPLDPPDPEQTTVGGLVAANLSGPLRASQGTVRDLLLGIRVVGADGAVVMGGGRVVKNVAGYDLPKLHVGALGTLGILIEATFKVRPRPEREEAVVITCASARTAAEIAIVVRETIDPLWLELRGPGGVGEFGPLPVVVVGMGGNATEVADARSRVLAAVVGRQTTVVAEGAALRARLGHFPLEPAAAVLRAAVLPTVVGAVLDTIEHAAGSAVRYAAHATSGIVRIAVAGAEAVPVLLDVLRPVVETGGGALVVERATPVVKVGLDVWGPPPGGMELMRRVKDTFDPAGILAPGRFVGGL